MSRSRFLRLCCQRAAMRICPWVMERSFGGEANLEPVRTWSVEEELAPQQGRFCQFYQPHSPAVGQKTVKNGPLRPICSRRFQVRTGSQGASTGLLPYLDYPCKVRSGSAGHRLVTWGLLFTRGFAMKPWSTLWAGALLALGLCAASHAQLLVGQNGRRDRLGRSHREGIHGAQRSTSTTSMPRAAWGQKIEIPTLDDQFRPQVHTGQRTHPDRDKGVLALFMTRGTRTPRASSGCWTNHVPLIGPPLAPWCSISPCRRTCSTCAPYQREVKSHWPPGHAGRAAHWRHPRGRYLWRRRTGWCAGGFQENQQRPCSSRSFDPRQARFQRHGTPGCRRAAGRHLHRHRSAVVDERQALRAAGVRGGGRSSPCRTPRGFVKAWANTRCGVVVTQVFPRQNGPSPTRWCGRGHRAGVKPRST